MGLATSRTLCYPVNFVGCSMASALLKGEAQWMAQ